MTARRPHRLLVALAIFAGLGVGDAGAQQPVTPPEPARPVPHDPLEGMEPSGRIPKVPFPEDLPNPERWRYFPEGRIKPGNVFQRLLVTSFISPQIFFEESIGVGGGIALTDIDFRNQRRREFLGAFLSYTTEGQQSYRAIWRRWLYHREIETGGVVLEERSFLDAFGGYRKTLTRRFFGLGPDTRPSAESSYTDENPDLGVRVDLALPTAGSDWVVSFGLRGEHHNLSRGRVEGVPSTDDAFPDQFQDGDDRDTLSIIGGIRYDTRDSQHQPYGGWRVGLIVDAPVYQNTGEPGAVFSAYGNVAFTLPPLFHKGGDRRFEENPPTDTLALGVFVQESVGDLAFYDLPSLGGVNTLRGYIANRFTGEAAWHAAAEYRFWVIPRGFAITRTIRIERIGLALFAEAGTVADSVADFPDARIHTSYGFGLRVGLERTATFRVDLGFSGEGPNFILSFGLPF
jgi:Omp85 superfamily domain